MNPHGAHRTFAVLGPAAAGLILLLAPPATRAQSAVSTVARSLSGVIVSPGAETLLCSGEATVTTTAVADPAQPGMLVAVDARGLACVGTVSKATYVNTGEATLTRLLVPGDVIRTTIAVYPDVPGGFLQARTGVLVLNLAFDTVTGALAGATAGLESAP
ncbi:MAG: hypothetical protein ACJ78Y_15985 [Myxococcales bacterium]